LRTRHRCFDDAPSSFPSSFLIKSLRNQFLAHRGATVAAKHYVGADVDVGVGKTPFQRLHEAQKKMYEALRPLMFAEKKKTAVVGEGTRAA